MKVELFFFSDEIDVAWNLKSRAISNSTSQNSKTIIHSMYVSKSKEILNPMMACDIYVIITNQYYL